MEGSDMTQEQKGALVENARKLISETPQNETNQRDWWNLRRDKLLNQIKLSNSIVVVYFEKARRIRASSTCTSRSESDANLTLIILLANNQTCLYSNVLYR